MQAIKLGLTGYAMNKIDGSVDVVAEGPRAVLELLLEYIQSGPVGARVTAVTHEWQAASGEFRTFGVR
jgi:acylphosphatase